MKKGQVTVLVMLITIMLAGCTNNQNKNLQEQNDLLLQQNLLLQEQANPQDTGINTQPGYVTDTTNTTNGTNGIDNTKTIPFEAVWPANNNHDFGYSRY